MKKETKYKMKRKWIFVIGLFLGFLIGMIAFAPLTSAILAGTCDIVIFPNVNDVEIEITNNSTDMEGFNWTKQGTLITYCVDLNYKADNFTVKWYNEEEVSLPQQGGGGGSFTKQKLIINETKNETEEIEIPTNNITENKEIIINEVKKSNKRYWIIGGIIILIIGGYFVLKFTE